jgi:hypothetical protein
MKTSLLFFLLSVVAVGGYSQNAKAPKAAKTDLATRFTNAASFKWYQEGKHFEAEAMENGREIAVAYDSKGKWIETERELDKGDLPAALISGFKTSMPDAEIVAVESVERANMAPAYEIKFKMDGKSKEMMFNLAGAPEEGQGGSGSGSGSGSGDEGSDEDKN